jgi:FkbM family methyltransferase
MGWFFNRKEKHKPRDQDPPPQAVQVHGFNLFMDLEHRIPGLPIAVIFDVGANVGQSTLEFRRCFPAAKIFCFEPVGSTFETLEKNVSGDPNLRAFRIALGSREGSAPMAVQKKSVNSALLRSPTAHVPPGATVEMVEVNTLDAFCLKTGIARIDFLKIDTEGWDLEVLKGGNAVLAGHQVKIIKVEAGMNPFNRKHVPLRELQSHLESLGYALFGLYDQTPEWSGKARLRFCNAVFLPSELADEPRYRRG